MIFRILFNIRQPVLRFIVMNAQSVISINPTGTPSGINIAKDLLVGKVMVARPVSALRKTAKILLGVSTSPDDSRRQWTFRLVLGTILMCFGALFLDGASSELSIFIVPSVATVMIASGVFIACGLLTRLVSFALGIILVIAITHIPLASMTGYSMLVCIAVCGAGIITASGRYSLDTLIYNGLLGSR